MSDDRFVYQPSSHKATEHLWWRELSRLHRNLCKDHLSIKRFWMFCRICKGLQGLVVVWVL